MLNKAYLDENSSKIEGQISYKEKDFFEFKKLSNEEVLIQRAVKTTIKLLYDKGLFDSFPNAAEVSKDFFVCCKT